MGAVVAEDVELERLSEGVALGKLQLDQLSYSLPLRRRIAGRGDEDAHELRWKFAHVASGCSLIWRRSASGSPGSTVSDIEAVEPPAGRNRLAIDEVAKMLEDVINQG
jgi:hypothetical protein